MRKCAVASRPLAFVLVLALAGCGAASKVEVTSPSGTVQMPADRLAVLMVSAPPAEAKVSYKSLWGTVFVPQAETTFAELAAYVAREEGGLDVMPAAEVRRRLKAQNIEPTLDPSPEQITAFSSALGCKAYLTARVEQWHYRFRLVWSKATISFVLSCRRPGEMDPLWSVRVMRQARNMSNREVAVEALREAFRALVRAQQES